jgi:hypothetical protein
MRNSALRSNYFQKHLSANPTAKERSEAVRTTLHEFPASTRPPPFLVAPSAEWGVRPPVAPEA